MNRCVSLSLSLTLAALAATNASAQNAQTLGPVESPQATQAAQANQAAQAAALAAAQSAQQAATDGQSLQRHFPQKALRGKILFGTPPFVQLDGNAMQMAAAYRVHGYNNLLLTSGQLVGVKADIDYTVDLNGQPFEIWLLTPAEVANKPWPWTTAEAAAWTFDPIAQTWTKP